MHQLAEKFWTPTSKINYTSLDSWGSALIKNKAMHNFPLKFKIFRYEPSVILCDLDLYCCLDSTNPNSMLDKYRHRNWNTELRRLQFLILNIWPCSPKKYYIFMTKYISFMLRCNIHVCVCYDIFNWIEWWFTWTGLSIAFESISFNQNFDKTKTFWYFLRLSLMNMTMIMMILL